MKKSSKLIAVLFLMLIVLSACSSGGENFNDPVIDDTGDSNNVIVHTEGSGNVTKDDVEKNKTELIAQADADYYFSHWKGDINSTYNPESIDNTSRREVTAVFLEENNSDTNETDTDGQNGVFKLINSWGDDWGAFNDGSHYISYEAAIENNLRLYLIAPRDNYQPKALAVFKLEAASRQDVEISFETANGSKKLYPTSAPYNFNGRMGSISAYQKGGSSAFPDNNLSLDITSLLPIKGEVTLKINNSGSSDIYLKNWQLEEYSSYPGNPVNTYNSNLNSEKISANSSRSFTMDLTIESSASTQALSGSKLDSYVRDYTESDWKNRKEEKIRTQSAAADNSGRGLKELSAEEMKSALEDGIIKTLDTAALGNGDLKVAGESKLDHSSSSYFPPVGNQGIAGSCASWSTVYYMLGFYRARDNGWDLSADTVSGVNQNHLMSPDFIYQLINGGQNGGTYYTDNLMMLANLGAATWAEMPADAGDYLSWGSEAAWRTAAANRVDYPIYYLQVNNYTDIKAAKELLDQGYLLSTAVDSRKYSSTGVWTADNYSSSYLDHANTVVGYDDGYQSSVEEISIK